jgi:putative transposase
MKSSTLCVVKAQFLGVHPSGYYAWRVQPVSARGVQDKRVSALIDRCWEDSGRIDGYRKISSDLNDM